MVRLGRYEIIEQMGTGAMGNVYRAHDSALDRAVALKTIRTGVDVAAEVRQRFYREARACARLQHPNIITVFDMGEAENTAYIAMELLEGEDFRRIIESRRSLPVETKIVACAEVCEAIAHAHRHGVIHRDVKPSNLFLTAEGRTKVLDFGIARLPSSQLTVAGQILGTPNYMAPEQILARPSDGRADLFSAAVVFFEFFTGTHPFQCKFIPQRIVQSDPDSLFDSGTSLPVILEEVLSRGMAKDPNQRYQTGDQFALDLRTVLDAIRGNASPGYSGFPLPSRHFIPAVQEESDQECALAIEPPPDQDPQEWRLSEALRLLPEFEAAIDARDIAKSRATLLDLEHRLSGDVRFTEAIRLCRSRLLELDPEPVATPAPLTVPVAPNESGWSFPADVVPEPAPALPPQLAVSDTTSFDLDATLFGSPAPAEISRQSTVAPPSSGRPPDETSPPPATPRQTPAPPSRPISLGTVKLDRRTIAIAAGVLVCAILVLVLGVVALRPVPVAPRIATAVVGVASAGIFEDPSAKSKLLATAKGGTSLNILRLPASRDQAWISVQLVRPKVFRAGYARVADLRDWRGQTSTTGLTLLRVFGPAESAPEEEIGLQIQKLHELTTRFDGEPAAREARLDAARWHMTLAQRRRSSGSPAEYWQADLKPARMELEPLSGDPVFQAQSSDLIKQIDELLNPEPDIDPPPPPVAPPPPPDIPAMLAKAGRLREDGDYAAAELILKQLLKLSPNNKDAQTLRDKIRRSQNAEIR